MHLRVPEPYDFALSTARFRDLGTDGATVLHEGGLHRVVQGREIRIEPAAGGVRLEPGSAAIAAEVGHLLGLPFDLEAFRAWAVQHEVLAPIVRALPGLRPPLHPGPFEALVVAVTTQQISLLAAAAIRGRFVERFGTHHEVAWEFPTRERVAASDPEEYPSLGFSRRKAEYVVGLARSDLDLRALDALPDEEVVETLTALPGIGRWTADWFLARHLARAEAWPAGDLGLRKAVSTFCAAGRPLSIDEVRALGERFVPFRNLSAHYLLAGARMNA
jgi:DNA-3-methyladenine glycosylase II